jgi:hypothetical protein
VRVGAEVERDLFERLSQLSKRNYRSMAAELRIAIETHVAKEEARERLYGEQGPEINQ